MDTLSTYTDRKARLLVVDDEANLRVALRKHLSLMGYHVAEAASGTEALELLDRVSYDLMVLDLHLPGIDGVEVMKRARQVRPEMSIVVLTGHASLESAIAAVKTNAADYMLKPADIDDFAAVISRVLQERAEQVHRQHLLNAIDDALDVLRQPTTSASLSIPSSVSPEHSLPSPEPLTVHPDRVLHVAPLTLDRQKRLVVMQGDPPHTAELTESEAAILGALMEHPNRVFSCVQLAHAAMGPDDKHDLDEWDARSIVRPCIHRLRRKVEVAPGKPKLICTIRGRGYFYSPS